METEEKFLIKFESGKSCQKGRGALNAGEVSASVLAVCKSRLAKQAQ